MTAVMREALERLNASSITSSSIRFSLTGGPVGWMTKTSAPRTLSWIWNHTSPSLKRARWARPRGIPRQRQMDSPRAGWALPVKTLSSLATNLRPRYISANSLRRSSPMMAGAEGFEPSYTGSKAPRLTAWPRPNRTRRLRRSGRRSLLGARRGAGPAPGALGGAARSCASGGGALRRRLRRHLLPVDREHLLLQVLAHLVVERVRDVLERSVLSFLARHRHEQALRAMDDLDVGHDEALIKD